MPHKSMGSTRVNNTVLIKVIAAGGRRGGCGGTCGARRTAAAGGTVHAGWDGAM